jgi:hypothetical protein
VEPSGGKAAQRRGQRRSNWVQLEVVTTVSTKKWCRFVCLTTEKSQYRTASGTQSQGVEQGGERRTTGKRVSGSGPADAARMRGFSVESLAGGVEATNGTRGIRGCGWGVCRAGGKHKKVGCRLDGGPFFHAAGRQNLSCHSSQETSRKEPLKVQMVECTDHIPSRKTRRKCTAYLRRGSLMIGFCPLCDTCNTQP